MTPQDIAHRLERKIRQIVELLVDLDGAAASIHDTIDATNAVASERDKVPARTGAAAQPPEADADDNSKLDDILDTIMDIEFIHDQLELELYDLRDYAHALAHLEAA